MAFKLWLGIDPGYSGALAAIDHAGHVTAFAFKDKTDPDIVNEFRQYSPHNLGGDIEIFALIERVHAMPGNGAVSMFTFGGIYKLLRASLIAFEIPHEDITPQGWQKEMRCLSKGDKNITKSKAQELFPSMKITHAIADAILLAEHCRRTRP